MFVSLDMLVMDCKVDGTIKVEYRICLFDKRRLSAKNVFCTQTDFVNRTEVHRQTMCDPRGNRGFVVTFRRVWFGE